MMKLRLHRKFKIHNNLAIFAAILLLVSSVVGFEANQETYSSGQETMSSVKADSADTDSESDLAEHKPRGLNLGLLLFRRG